MYKLRNLNIVLLVIAFFFLLTSLMFYFYLQKVDSDYTKILSDQKESFHRLRKITKLSNSNFLLIYQAYLKPDINTDSMKVIWSNGMAINSENFHKLYPSVNGSKAIDSIYHALIQSRKKYKNACNQFFTLHCDVGNSKSEDFYTYTVQPSFLEYQNNLDNFSEAYKAQIEKESDSITSSIHKDSLSLLFFGFSPVALIISGILFLLLLIIGFIFSFNMRIISLDI